MNIQASEIAMLPIELRPREVPELIRLGRGCDGGYVVDRRSVLGSDWLLGLGLNDDWSFEQDFRNSIELPIAVYDGSVGTWVFARKLVQDIVKMPFKKLVGMQSHTTPRNRYGALREYPKFFSGEIRHYKQHVGRDMHPKEITLKSAFDNSIPKSANNIFLKMDIEGSEYFTLNDINNESKRLSGAVIEFHDVAKRMNKILEFIDKFELGICHVHCNNALPLNGWNVPEIVEVSFTKFETRPSENVQLPNEHDKPNLMDRMDYEIRFRDFSNS